MKDEILKLLDEAIALENRIIYSVDGEFDDLYTELWQKTEQIRKELSQSRDRMFLVEALDIAHADKTLRKFGVFYNAYLEIFGDRPREDS